MPFFALDGIPPTQQATGISRRAVYLEHVMLTFFDFEAGAVVPAHQHPHEQITYVVAGALQFTLANETQILRAGQGATIPPGVPHSAIALEPTQALDGWYPIREDYR